MGRHWSTGTKQGDAVCVCANVLGVWIRNPLQVVYTRAEAAPAAVARQGALEAARHVIDTH